MDRDDEDEDEIDEGFQKYKQEMLQQEADDSSDTDNQKSSPYDLPL